MRCRISLRPFVIGALASVLAPSVAHAQSTIAGVVKDASGAVTTAHRTDAAGWSNGRLRAIARDDGGE